MPISIFILKKKKCLLSHLYHISAQMLMHVQMEMGMDMLWRRPEMSYDEHFHKVKLFKFKSQAQVKTLEKI